MQRLMILFVLNVFLISAAAGDDGCCDSEQSFQVSVSQALDQDHDNHHSDSSGHTDCRLCINCFHCGGAPNTEAKSYSLSFFKPFSNDFAQYFSLIAPSPDIDGPFQPPKA